MTPLELFNFLPDVQAKAICHMEGELKARQDHHNQILHDFVYLLIAIKDFEPGTMDNISKYPATSLSIASAKINGTFDKPGTDRQCCIEILAFSKVINAQNERVKFVVLIKACRNKFQTYIYFNQIDLIRTSPVELDNSLNAPNIIGVFAF